MVTDNRLGFTDIRGILAPSLKAIGVFKRGNCLAVYILQVSAQRVWCNVGVVIMAVTRVTIIPSTLLYHMHDGAIDDEAEQRAEAAERSGDDVVAGHWHYHTPRHR
jgi:hypothetical protein